MANLQRGHKRPWSDFLETQPEAAVQGLSYGAEVANRGCLPDASFQSLGQNLVPAQWPWGAQNGEPTENGCTQHAFAAELPPQITLAEHDASGDEDYKKCAPPATGEWLVSPLESHDGRLSPAMSMPEWHDSESTGDVLTHSSSFDPIDDNFNSKYDTCFGMIQSTAPNLRLNALGSTENSRIDVKLQSNGRVMTVRHHDSLAYGGLLERKISEPLMDLSERFQLTFIAFLLLKKQHKNIPRDYKLCIALHGERKDADDIGELLSNADIYLQPPQAFQPSVPYFNPQYLYRPGTEESIVQTQDPFEQGTKTPTVLADDDPLKYQVLQAFDSAQGPQRFSEVRASPRLRTPLTPHQQKALSMMMEKESGRMEANEFGTMWTPFAHSSGQIRYRNNVTGCVQFDKPLLCLGGLLADEPGLGKTLSMLGLITLQLDNMEHWNTPHDGSSLVRTTMIVTPMSVLQTWEEQIERHILPGKISYCIYHGSSRQKSPSELNEFDIVLTTYDTLVAEAQKRGHHSGRAKSLSDLEWRRIVLDEAHVIRNPLSKRHQVLKELRSRHRWCLTGSPMFNRVQDFGALLSFLCVPPFHDLRFFNSQISIPLNNYPEKALETLRKLVQSISLRRIKASVLGDLDIPARETRIEEVFLDDQERQQYGILKKSYTKILEAQPSSNPVNKYGQGIFQTISRLRQFCDHGLTLLPRSALVLFEDSFDGNAVADELLKASETCGICMKTPKLQGEEGAVDSPLECGHPICSHCEKKTQDSELNGAGSCKLCLDSRALSQTASRTPGHLSPSPQLIASMDLKTSYTPSSKVTALMKNLKTESMDLTKPPLKSVVFSCWTKMLDQVEKAIETNRLQFERIDGSKSDSARRTALERFRAQEGYCILLASIGSAGVGLDLTAASRVHLIEPQWSPMAEEQALDRVHRMGQTREVIATRYVVNNSIEEYVISVQDMKSMVIEQSFEGNGHMEKLTAKERFMKYLEES